MSIIDYFMFCPEHHAYVFLTDDKGNPPNRAEVRQFIMDHGGCDVVLRSASEVPFDAVLYVADKDANSQGTKLVT